MDDLVFYYPMGHEAHIEPWHPERPERIEAIREALEMEGWWNAYPHLDPVSLPLEVLQAIHTPAYLSTLEEACKRGQHLDPDTYTRPASWQLALKTAGGAASVASRVWKGQAQRGFALTRPPGHHATPRRGMGFCLMNNIALAAEYLLQQEGAERLSIIDLDLHHGNGTQEIFYRRGEVSYFSTHQAPFYPHTGWLDERGAGQGSGMKMNLPFPPGSGDHAFRAAMEQVILPLLDRFQPQMILVSIGFDTHWRDPIGSLLLSAGEYGQLIESLVIWADAHCKGRIALILEGGYDLLAGAACAQAATAALLGKSWKDPLGPAPQPETQGWKPVVEQALKLWGL